MTGKLSGLTFNRDGTQNLTITLNADFAEEYDKLKDDEIKIEIKKNNKLRSYEANAFLWHLCSEIAKRTSKFSDASKEDIYREAIRAKGIWDGLWIRADAVSTFIRNWSEHGIGWFADIVDEFHDKKGNLIKEVHVYSGTSTYDSSAMSRVVDYVVLQAEELGIPTITPKEMERMMGNWAKKHDEKVVA